MEVPQERRIAVGNRVSTVWLHLVDDHRSKSCRFLAHHQTAHIRMQPPSTVKRLLHADMNPHAAVDWRIQGAGTFEPSSMPFHSVDWFHLSPPLLSLRDAPWISTISASHVTSRATRTI